MDHDGISSAFDQGSEGLVCPRLFIRIRKDRAHVRVRFPVRNGTDGHSAVGTGNDPDLRRLNMAAKGVQIAEQIRVRTIAAA